ncbi:MAG: aromatic ring-hydroxylating dioxygenase subunit alpha [Sphingomonadaceae bacterium]|nr:aromatic ring-hydroxylating dioxygenase subunit alpha [Sphingomonadaceae bacterium]
MATALAETGRPTVSYREVLERDARGYPELMREQTLDMGLEPIPASRYTSPEFFKREVEKVWFKTWQYVCREEHVPNVGDTHVYELLNKQVIVTRQADGSLKAMQNVCLHRGRKLVTQGGCKQQFRCPYHGLTWNIDGSFKENPFGWDFPQIDSRNFPLPEIRLETWAGFVFINFDKDAEPLLKQLAPMPEHFAHWRIEDCTMVAHVGKIVPANWKATAEAFIESHHVFTTHPQLNPTNGYESCQYDVLSDHVTRFMNPSGMTPTVYHEQLDEEQRIERMFKTSGRMGESQPMAPEPGMTARNYAGAVSRKLLETDTGREFPEACDADLVDGISYDFFPNFHLWGGLRDKICYRFRPVGMDPNQTFMEVMLFRIAPKDGPKPEPARFNMLGPDDMWSSATELAFLASVYDQDQSNMGPVQEGLRALGDEGVIHFSKYMEVRCRHLHHMVDVYMNR